MESFHVRSNLTRISAGIVALAIGVALVPTSALATLDLLTPPADTTSSQFGTTQNSFTVFRLVPDCDASITGAVSQMNTTNANNYTVEFRSDLSGNPGPVFGSLTQANLGSATVTYSGAIDVVTGGTYWVGVRGSTVGFLSNVAIRTGSQSSQWRWATGVNNRQFTSDAGGSWTSVDNSTQFPDLTLKGTCSEGGGGGASGDPSQPSANKIFVLSLVPSLPPGVTCSWQEVQGRGGSWVLLPGAEVCTTSSPNSPTLLGWGTDPNFPVDIAQRQVDNAWGAYETYGDDGQLTGVFIPAGGYTAVTGDTNLYPIWSE